jgi:type I site-specific restriction endonuclease
MGWGDKEAILAQNAGMKREIELLREMLEDKKKDVEDLRESLRATQEALVAKESPEAYRDQREAREQAPREYTEEEKATMAQMKAEAERTQKYIDELEDPLFRDADQMFEFLAPSLAPDIKSLHGDNES